MNARILAVHGYEIGPDGVLYDLSAAVCDKVSKVQAAYDQIFLLGGWHLHEVGPRPTIGEAMKSNLLARGLPAGKLYNQFDLGLDHIQPCRDTAEETWMLASFLRAAGYTPRSAEFDALVVTYFRPRARRLYTQTGGRCLRILGADSHQVWQPKRLAIEVVALALTCIDPTCQLKQFQDARKGRTVESRPDCRPPVLSDWEG